MSEKDIEQEQAVVEPPDEATAEATPADAPRRERPGRPVAWLALVVAVVAVAVAGYSAWQDWRRASDTAVADQVARLNSRVATTTQSIAGLEARIGELNARDPGVDVAIDELRRELEERIRLLNSLPARISTLEGSVASLAGVSEGARDAWILAESEYYLQIANAQLQLANNPQLASLALRLADERIVQLANPALTDVRRAISDELASLDVMEKPDIEGATLTLASLARVVESLPLAGTASDAPDATAADPEQSGPSRAWSSVKRAMSGLVTVTPPERARLMQLSADAEFFLRNNIALQLQTARLALLRGEQAIFEQTLEDTRALLNGYFDTNSAAVIGALDTIGEIQGHVFTTATPDISESLSLLRRFRTLHESAQ